MADIQYPIGRFSPRPSLSPEDRRALIRELAELPAMLRRAVAGLSPEQLDTPYRDGGWSPRQIVHHIADSHMNTMIRFKLALTEQEPAVKPFDQDAWASTPDVAEVDPSVSMSILEGVHARLVALLSSLKGEDFSRCFHHPERGRLSLDYNLQLYAWHGRHHATQIAALRQRRSW